MGQKDKCRLQKFLAPSLSGLALLPWKMSSTHWGAKCVWISWGNCSGAWEAVPSCCCCTSLLSPLGGAWRSQWAVKRRTCCSPRCPTLPVTLVLSQQHPLKWSLSVLQKAHQGIHSTTCTEEELWNALPTSLYVLLWILIFSLCCVLLYIHVNWVFRSLPHWPALSLHCAQLTMKMASLCISETQAVICPKYIDYFSSSLTLPFPPPGLLIGGCQTSWRAFQRLVLWETVWRRRGTCWRWSQASGRWAGTWWCLVWSCRSM